MNERARRRAMRNVVASIMMSNLSKNDVLDVADEFAFGMLGRELGDMLRHMSVLLPDAPSEHYPQAVSYVEPPLSAVVYEIVQRKKMTKKALVQAIGSVAPRLVKNELPSGTIKEILDWFFEVASPNQSSRLVALLSDTAQDPYLKGISRRS
jgi:hypothetical protein